MKQWNKTITSQTTFPDPVERLNQYKNPRITFKTSNKTISQALHKQAQLTSPSNPSPEIKTTKSQNYSIANILISVPYPNRK
jgi:hypothetical protein